MMGWEREDMIAERESAKRGRVRPAAYEGRRLSVPILLHSRLLGGQKGKQSLGRRDTDEAEGHGKDDDEVLGSRGELGV